MTYASDDVYILGLVTAAAIIVWLLYRLWIVHQRANAAAADAIQRSRAIIIGKVTEHVVPYLPDFAFNPKDARFIGSPVDLVVFDGLDDEAVKQIVFVEVKASTTTSLTKRER